MIETEQDFVERVARRMVAEHAPDELPLFEPVSAVYHRDPQRVLSGARRADPPPVLGTAVTFLTPVALAVGTAAYRHLVGGDGGVVAGSPARSVLNLLRRTKPESPAVERGEDDEVHDLGAVCDLAFRRGVELGLGEPEARKLSASLRESLGD